MIKSIVHWFIPLVFAAPLLSSEIVYNAPISPPEIPEVEVPISAPIVEPTPRILPKPPSIYCSCVFATREIYPNLPIQDAILFKGNGNVDNSEIVILQYKSSKSDGYIWHIAPYHLGTSTLHIYNEGN